MVRGSAEILATSPYHALPSDWDALKAFSDGFTPEGIFRSAYTFLISTDGTDIYVSNAFQTVYGGSGDVGIEGDDADATAIFQKCIDECNSSGGGLIAVRAANYKFAGSLAPKSNVHFFIEAGTTFTWIGAEGSNFIANTTRPIVNFCIEGDLTVDINNIATTNAVVLDTIQKCHFKGTLTIKNVLSGTSLKILAAGPTPIANGGSNSYRSSFDVIHIEDSMEGITFTGNEANVEVTLLDFNKVYMERITSKGVAFKGWASGIQFDTAWIWLSAAGAKGVIWNDSATPTVNVGDYDNNFVNLKVDPFGAADHATTTLLTFNCTKENYVWGFFHSGATTFLGTVLNDIAETVSYYVQQTDASQNERAATKDNYIRVISKGVMHGTHIVDELLVYGDVAGTGAYISLNDLYEATTPTIYMRTKTGGVNKQATFSLTQADTVLRLNTPSHFVIKLPDADGTSKLRIDDNANVILFQVDSNGNVGITGTVEPEGGYHAADSTTGETDDVVIGAVTLSFKNGLFVGHT